MKLKLCIILFLNLLITAQAEQKLSFSFDGTELEAARCTNDQYGYDIYLPKDWVVIKSDNAFITISPDSIAFMMPFAFIRMTTTIDNDLFSDVLYNSFVAGMEASFPKAEKSECERKILPHPSYGIVGSDCIIVENKNNGETYHAMRVQPKHPKKEKIDKDRELCRSFAYGLVYENYIYCFLALIDEGYAESYESLFDQIIGSIEIHKKDRSALPAELFMVLP